MIVEAEWQAFVQIARVPTDDPEALRNLRRGFYAGATMLMCQIMSTLDPGSEPTDRDVDLIGAIRRELVEFNEKVKRGEA